MMESVREAIVWRGERPGGVLEGTVRRAVFYCGEDAHDVTRMQVTCETSSCVLNLELQRNADGRFAGECAISDLTFHTLLSRQNAACALFHSADGGAMLMAVAPMKICGMDNLYWILRTGRVVRNLEKGQ